MSQAPLACSTSRFRRWVIGITGVLAAWACNALTGIGDLSFDGVPDASIGGKPSGGSGGSGGSPKGGETGVGGSAGALDPGGVEWAIALHATNQGPNVRALELASGKLFVCGNFDGDVDFGVGGNVTSVTPDDAFLLARDASSGAAIWAHALFGTSIQDARDLVDVGGKLVIVGNYRNAIDFGTPTGQTTPLTLQSGGSDQLYWATFSDDAAGVPVDATGVAGSASELAGAVASDANGNLYLYGSYRGSPDFGSGGLPAPQVVDGGSTDSAFVVQRSPSGSIGYALSLDYFNRDLNGSFFGGLAVDAAGDAYVAGSFNQTFSVNTVSGTLDVTHQSEQDAFLLALNPAGKVLWAKTIAGGGSQLPWAVAVDSGKNPIWVGTFQNTVSVSPSGPWQSAGTDSFLVKYSADGSKTLWAKRFADPENDSGTVGAQTARGVAVDSADNVYVIGEFDKFIDFRDEPGQAPLTSAGSTDVFVAKYSKDGALLWVAQFGNTSGDHARAITTDGTRVAIAGTFFGTLTLGKTILVGPEVGTNPATFIASLAP